MDNTEKKSQYKGFTPAQARAHKKYMENFVELRARVSFERRREIQAHAEARGESVNGFINRAIQEAMERDNAASGGAVGRTDAEKEAGG